MANNSHLTIEQKMQICLRIKMGQKDREIAREFHKSRSRITQIRLYEMRHIESEYRKKKMLKPMFEAVDKMIEIIGDEEE
jgi:transcriptional regulator